MVAVYDYAKQIDDEVDLHAGEEVTIIEQGIYFSYKISEDYDTILLFSY